MVTVFGKRPSRPTRLDALLAVLSAAAVVAGTVAAANGQLRIRPLDIFGVILLIAAAAAAIGLRRAAPLWALAATTLLVNAYVLAGYPFGPVLLCLVVAVFEVARQRPLTTSALACGMAAAVSSATIFVRVVGDHHASGMLALAWTGWSVLPWSLGALVHVVQAARRRSDRELAARAALQERMRIAADVHDIAGHAFALITMQAQVAMLVFDEQPDQARRSLEAVRDTSSTALAGLRRMLDAVHPSPGLPVPVSDAYPDAPASAAATSHPAPAEPTFVEAATDRPAVDPIAAPRPPGLTELIKQVQASGLPVETAIDADCDMPEPLNATVYRVVQEALTNVLRHAGPTRARVSIERHDGQVLLRVTDQGRGTPATIGPPGRGLAGMRRRVEAAHGRLETGPRDGGGFQVQAWLPLPEGAS